MSAIIGAIKGMLSGKGTDLINSVGNVVDNLTLSNEEKEKFKIEVMKITNDSLIKMEQEAVKKLEVELKDMDSARQREMQIATSDKAPLLNKIITPIIGLAVIVLTFILFYMIMFKGLKGVEKDILIYVLGALTSFTGMILSYYFGSSSGSQRKQDLIEKSLKNG
jgi:hypothetical protein